MLYTLFLMMVDFLIAETGHGCWIPHFEWGHLVHSTYSSAVEGYVDQKQKPLAGTEAFGWDDVVVLTSTVAIGFSLGVWKWDKSMNIHESYLIPSGKLVNIQKTMEHHHFSWVNPLFLPFSMSLFVCLPEGICVLVVELCWPGKSVDRNGWVSGANISGMIVPTPITSTRSFCK